MADFSGISDEQLIGKGLSQQDSEKITELISRNISTVFALAGKYSGSADYQELASDGLEALMSAILNYDSEKGGFSAYCYTCISNRMKNTVDKSIRRSAKLVSEEMLEDIPSGSPTPEELVIMRENTTELHRRMHELLTPLEHRCLDGVILGYSYEQIAQKLSVSRKSVDNAVSRARAKLREVFPDF